MSFLSVQKFDDQGQIQVISKVGAELVSINNGQGQPTGQARVKFDVATLTASDLVPFDNLADAEKFVLTDMEVFYSMGTPPLNHVDVDSRLAHRISTAAAHIGHQTKRGYGNTIVCHPSRVGQVDQCWDKIKTVMKYNPISEEQEPVEQPYFGNGPLDVFVTENAPEDQVLVLYRGEKDTDQPLIYVEGKGLLLNSKLIDVEHYGNFVRIP